MSHRLPRGAAVRRALADGSVVEIPEEERYFHQVCGGVLALSAILRVMTHQRLPVLRVAPFNQYQRNRFFLPH